MFEDDIRAFFESAKEKYREIASADPSLKGKRSYIFQTGEPVFQPDLMIVGINPGADYPGEFTLTNDGGNKYVEDSAPWFGTLRSVIPIEYLKDCVGTNKYYVNTPQEKDIRNMELKSLGTQLTRTLIDDVIKPKHIICLGDDVFNTIKIGPCRLPVPGLKFKVGDRKGIPVAYIPNPSPRNSGEYRKEQFPVYREAVRNFMQDTL